MTRHLTLHFAVPAILVVFAAGCGSSPIRISQPPLGATPTAASVQALYESGRDDEAVTRAASPSVSSVDVWFGAQSLLRMGQRAEAADQFRRLRDTADSDGFRRAADVALARVTDQGDAAGVARNAAAADPGNAYVQFEAGVTLALQGDAAAAAAAFDAAINAAPQLAYAYYQAGLAYNRLNRPDLSIARFDTFVRLAPQAPERPQVDSILRTARGVR